MRINILNYYIKSSINFNNYYHFYGLFLSHIYILLSYLIWDYLYDYLIKYWILAEI